MVRVTYHAADTRYDSMTYRRCGRSGIQLPPLSLGLWQNFGDDRTLDTQRAIIHRAFDLGITHFDLANNYGPPYGSAEINFGRMMAEDLKPYRNEIVISTKAGWDMWPGPYGDLGSRKYLLSSLDESLQRMGLDYVDIFYSHRFDPDTPLEETMGALDTAVRQGKALYVGISSYSDERTREAAAILEDLGTPLLIHQPSYSMLNRWIEPELLDALGDVGRGLHRVHCAGAGHAHQQVPERHPGGLARGQSTRRSTRTCSTTTTLARIRGLDAIAEKRGQSLAQMALVWALRDARMTSLVIGASSVKQLEENVKALDNLDFTDDELARRSTSTPSTPASTSGKAPPPPDGSRR